jgi:hypothetical protein
LFELRLVFSRIPIALIGCALTANAQTPIPPQTVATTASPVVTPNPPASSAIPVSTPALAPPMWSIGSIDFSGYLDGYYSFNANRPSDTANGQTNDFYNFSDKTDQFNLSAAKLTINHDADPIGVHIDLLFGRTNILLHPATDLSTDSYIEQAYVSAKPAKVHGTEVDVGQFVTSAGAEVIEAKDDWNYSRSLLFSWATPYYHFGLRTTTPVTKTWTAGLQVVNGWNNVVDNNGGVTIGLTSALTKPKYGWAANYYTGPENANTQKGYRILGDTTLTLTPTAKLSAYVNYDYVQNRTALPATVRNVSQHLSGVAFAVHEAVTSNASLTGRFEFFHDNSGFSTGTAQKLKEFTATYEYKWAAGLLSRVEYRRDWSDQKVFHKGNLGMAQAQSTLTVAMIAFFGPKR